MAKFVHLHVHTEYSLLDGIAKIKKLVARAKDLGMDTLALTDHGVMYGAIEFYKACKEAGIKPIIGCEMYVAPRSYKLKEGKIDAEPYHLTVLARDYTGYKNLMKLVSIAQLEGYYYRPRVDRELLKQYHEGLIALSACPGGEFIRNLTNNKLKEAEQVAKDYLEIFGEGNYYFEVQRHHWKEHALKAIDPKIAEELNRMGDLEELTINVVKDLSPKLGIPIVATKDSHYIKKEDAEAHDAVLCVQTGKFVTDIDRLRMIDTPEFYLASPEEMVEAYLDLPEAVENTVKLAEKCNVEMELGVPKFPVFPIEDNTPPMKFLRDLTYQRAAAKLEITPEIRERLEYELEIIDYKKYADYFLVVADFMIWANDHGIITNTRGSAAGSLVLYCLGITNLNPLEYKLPFERFLTKTRPTMPDIDADLADDRREEVIAYVTEKYGKEKVAQIVTFGTMQGRAAIRDIGRVLGIPYGEVDKIAKLVPPPKQGFHTLLEEHLKTVTELRDIYNSDSRYKKMIDLACKVEGTVRHASVHAAGILIAPDDITNYAPLQRESNGDKVVSQYDMFSAIDEYGGIGLVKMDFLGLRNLSILGRAIEFVQKNQGITVNLEKIPLDDKKSYELMARGETMGLFQLSGAGITKYLIDLKPTNIYDIMAMVALYRPGPLSIIPEYIARKKDPSKVTFIDERMREYMETSLGLLVYQEDVILTAINIAKYSWEDADKFRKAMGKKKPEEMAKQRDKFVKGCVGNEMDKKKAEELFDLIEAFAAYGFNKSHAASYGVVAYHTAYMKANFPVEFMAALMTAEYGDSEKIALAIDECKRMGIAVMPPDINYSFVGFTIEEVKDLPEDQLKRHISPAKEGTAQAVRFGLSAIKNVGLLAIESIIKAREDKSFASLSDLCSRVDTRLVNRKALESLIKAGALDSFGSRAAQLLAVDECLEEAHKLAKQKSLGQISLFGEETDLLMKKVNLTPIDEMPLDKLLEFERDLLGFYLHEPPYLERLRKLDDFVSIKLKDLSESENEVVGKKVVLGGVVMEAKKVITKKSASEMAFVRLFDGTGEIESVVFPKVYEECKDCLVKEQVVLITGKVEKRDEDFSILADSVEIFNPETSARLNLTSVEIEIPNNADGSLLQKVNSTLRQYPGEAQISILIPSGQSFKKMNLAFTVNPDLAFIENMESLLGRGTVKISD